MGSNNSNNAIKAIIITNEAIIIKYGKGCKPRGRRKVADR